MTQASIQHVRDLLAPGLVSIERTLGLGDVGQLIAEEHRIALKITKDGRTKEYAVASEIEITAGTYKETFLPRVRAAFDDFLRGEGVTGVAEYLEKRGPRELEAVDDSAGPAPPQEAA